MAGGLPRTHQAETGEHDWPMMVLEDGADGIGMGRLVYEARRLVASPTESTTPQRLVRECGGERGLMQGSYQTSRVSSVYPLTTWLRLL